MIELVSVQCTWICVADANAILLLHRHQREARACLSAFLESTTSLESYKTASRKKRRSAMNSKRTCSTSRENTCVTICVLDFEEDVTVLSSCCVRVV